MTCCPVSDWIKPQEENASCKFGALQVIKVVRPWSAAKPETRSERKCTIRLSWCFYWHTIERKYRLQRGIYQLKLKSAALCSMEKLKLCCSDRGQSLPARLSIVERRIALVVISCSISLYKKQERQYLLPSVGIFLKGLDKVRARESCEPFRLAQVTHQQAWLAYNLFSSLW